MRIKYSILRNISTIRIFSNWPTYVTFFSVGGSIPIVWAYFGEFQPKDKRGRMLSWLAAFWMVGNVTVAGARESSKTPKQFLWNWQLFCLIPAIAWIIIPLDIGYNTTNPDEFEYNSWRVFTALCGVPALLVAISLIWCPESPKFLLSKGRHREALEVFSKIYATNTKKPPSDYPVEKNRNQKSRDKRH